MKTISNLKSLGLCYYYYLNPRKLTFLTLVA